VCAGHGQYSMQLPLRAQQNAGASHAQHSMQLPLRAQQNAGASHAQHSMLLHSQAWQPAGAGHAQHSMQLRSQAWQHAVCVKPAQLMGLLALTSTQQKSLELSCTLGKVHDGWHVIEHLCHQMARYVHCEAGTRIAHIQHTSQDATWSSTWQALGTSCQPINTA
jgi:hypothetical protein